MPISLPMLFVTFLRYHRHKRGSPARRHPLSTPEPTTSTMPGVNNPYLGYYPSFLRTELCSTSKLKGKSVWNVAKISLIARGYTEDAISLLSTMFSHTLKRTTPTRTLYFGKEFNTISLINLIGKLSSVDLSTTFHTSTLVPPSPQVLKPYT